MTTKQTFSNKYKYQIIGGFITLFVIAVVAVLIILGSPGTPPAQSSNSSNSGTPAPSSNSSNSGTPSPSNIPVKCDENKYLSNNTCISCPSGTSSASGSNICSDIICGLNQYVSNNKCTPCQPGKISQAGKNANGPDTTCTSVICGVDQYVSNNKCTPCKPGTTFANGGSDASKSDTTCDNILCGKNQYVSSHTCVNCQIGYISNEGANAGGPNTTCTAKLNCLVNEYVEDNQCVPCATGTTAIVGSSSTGPNTYCDYKSTFKNITITNSGGVLTNNIDSKNSSEIILPLNTRLPSGKYTNFKVTYKGKDQNQLNDGATVRIQIRNRDDSTKIKATWSNTLKANDVRPDGKIFSYNLFSSMPFYIDNEIDLAFIQFTNMYPGFTTTIEDGSITLDNSKTQQCSAGKYYDYKTNSCVLCPAGFYCNGSNQNSIKCPPFTFSPQSGASLLSHCNPVDIYGGYGTINGDKRYPDKGVKKYSYNKPGNSNWSADFSAAMGSSGMALGDDNRRVYLDWDIDGMTYLSTEGITDSNDLENFFQRVCVPDSKCDGVVKSGNLLYAMNNSTYYSGPARYMGSASNLKSQSNSAGYKWNYYKYNSPSSNSVILTKAA